MKTFRFLVFALLGTGLLLRGASAQETSTQATIVAVKGASTVRITGGGVVPATVGQKLAAGALIATGPDAQLSLQVHEGIVAVVGAVSQIEIEKLSVGPNGMRNAMLRVRTGNLATSLDPAKKSVNNYGVRTDQGVALARGTTMTVSVANNVYTVSVLAGSVTVNWADGRSIGITGNTPADVTSYADGRVGTVSLSAALASGENPGLPEALVAAAAAIATTATTPAQVTAVITLIAAAAGSNPDAPNTVAAATAAATRAAVGNSALVAGAGDPTAVAAIISTAAVTAATAAGNGAAAGLIVSSAVNAVAVAIPGTNIQSVAAALAGASNAVAGNAPVNVDQVTTAVTLAQNPLSSAPSSTVVDQTTPVTPLNPDISVSPSRG